MRSRERSKKEQTRQRLSSLSRISLSLSLSLSPHARASLPNGETQETARGKLTLSRERRVFSSKTRHAHIDHSVVKFRWELGWKFTYRRTRARRCRRSPPTSEDASLPVRLSFKNSRPKTSPILDRRRVETMKRGFSLLQAFPGTLWIVLVLPEVWTSLKNLPEVSTVVGRCLAHADARLCAKRSRAEEEGRRRLLLLLLLGSKRARATQDSPTTRKKKAHNGKQALSVGEREMRRQAAAASSLCFGGAVWTNVQRPVDAMCHSTRGVLRVGLDWSLLAFVTFRECCVEIRHRTRASSLWNSHSSCSSVFSERRKCKSPLSGLDEAPDESTAVPAAAPAPASTDGRISFNLSRERVQPCSDE